jgi:predicted nucleic acid-binding protein
MAVVVDASAIAAILFGEAGAEEVVGAMEGQALLAPTLLPYEVGSVAVGKLRRRTATAEEVGFALGELRRLRISLVEVAAGELVAVAARAGITACDAAYAQLARSRGAKLVTLDRKLRRAYAELQ